MIAALLLAAVSLGPFVSSGNFTVDLLGTPDTRPDTWGLCASQSWQVKFAPPPGYRVRILSIQGDLISFPRVLPGEPPPAAGTYSGVLLGYQTTAEEGSRRCDWCADNTFLYVQDVVSVAPRRAPYRVRPRVLLGPDNVMVVKVAIWLNTTGHAIHIEPTYTVRYEWVPSGESR